MSQFQNILPKHGASPPSTSSQGLPASIGRTGTQNSGGSSEADSTSAPKRVSTACSACKTRKSKCDGRQPCERCVRHKTECIIDEDEDLRRRRAVKRKLEDLEADRRLLLHLIAALRESNDVSVMPILNLIRQSGSLDCIRKFLESEAPLPPETAERHLFRKTGEDGHPRPSTSPSPDEPPPRRRALDIGNLLNATEDQSSGVDGYPFKAAGHGYYAAVRPLTGR